MTEQHILKEQEGVIDLQEKIINIAARSFRMSTEDLHMDSGTEDTEGWDSLTHLAFATGLENEFDIRLSTVDIMKIVSLQDALHIINEKRDQ